MTRRWRVAVATLVAGTGAGVGSACTEDLTIPGNCPEFCVGGNPRVEEILLPALPGSDSAFFGYTGNAGVPALLVSSGLEAGEARAWYKFASRPDTVGAVEGFVKFSVDSVALTVSLVARDSLATGLALLLYRLPLATADTLTPFEALDAALTPEAFLDSIPVPDSVRFGPVRVVIAGEGLAKLTFAPEDSGQLALGIGFRAPAGSGVRLTSLVGGGATAIFDSFVRLEIADTSRQRQTLTVTPEANGYVLDRTRVVSPDLLYLGGLPAARSIMRFALPKVLTDSATLLRATLELVPAEPLIGLPNDDPQVDVRGVTKDLGAKSSTLALVRGITPLPAGTQDTVRVELLRIVDLWLGATPLPPVLFVGLSPEGASFHQPVFFSTRSLEGRPALRVIYLLPAPVERP